MCHLQKKSNGLTEEYFQEDLTKTPGQMQFLWSENTKKGIKLMNEITADNVIF